MNSLNRRTVLKGSLIAAATAPVLVDTAHADGHTAMYPRIGQRVVIMDDRVIGVVAASTVTPPVRSPSSGILEEVEYSNELIARLLWASYYGEAVDPRVAEPSQFAELANIIMEEEGEARELLMQSELYWVQTNPVFLYAITGATWGAVASLVVYPFLQGFFQELGAEAAGWLLNLR